MAGERAMSASDVGIRTRTRSRSRDTGRGRLRSRSRSPLDRRGRQRDADGEGYRERWRDADGDLEREREGMRDGDEREFERSSKRRRFDYRGDGDRADERSPLRGSEKDGRAPESRQHRRDDDHHRRRHHSARRNSAERTSSRKELPFGARELSRSDLAAFRPLFAHYLDLQKRLDIDSLDETALRGRWKSFMGKWNRGELAEGWYDPEVFAKAARDYQHHDAGNSNQDRLSSPPRSTRPVSQNTKPSPSRSPFRSATNNREDDEEEDDFGPPPPPAPGQQPHHPSHTQPPPSSSSTTTRAPGPSIPTQTDLSLRDEALAAEHSTRLSAHRLASRAHRAEEKALLDETLPRAEAGTRERRLEKRRELNEKLKGFREKSPGGGEVGEGELMGGGDAVEEYRAMLRVREEKRRERVSRREEVERARRAEREERVRVYREREERVVEGLRALARERFGGGQG